LRCHAGKATTFRRMLTAVLAWATWESWPAQKSCAASEIKVPKLLEEEVADEDGVQQAVLQLKKGFCPPCAFALLHCQRPRVDFIYIAVSHALCDATSFLPLRSDLIALYLGESGGPEANLSPSGDAMSILHKRFRAAVWAHDPKGEPDQTPYLAGWEPAVPAAWGYRRMMLVQSGAGAVLQHVSHMLNVPVDVLLIVCLACSIARIDGTPVVRLTLTTPMRDGSGEGLLVGCFSDWRDLDVHTHALQTLVSVALQTADTVRRRYWTRGRMAQVSQRMLVNLVATDDSDDRGFAHRAELGCMQPPTPSGRVRCYAERPMEVQGWQTSPVTWTLALRLHSEQCPPTWAAHLASTLPKVIEQFLLDPLAPVHAPG